MGKIQILISALSLFLLSPLTHANADVLHLTNGDILTGSVVSFSKGLCTFSAVYGGVFAVSSKDIKNIYTDDTYSIEFSNGDAIKGQLVKNNNGLTVLKSNSFGEVHVAPSNISNMTIIQASDNPVTSTKENPKIEEGYGKKEEEDPPLDFLTGSTVLLTPGLFELEFGANYKQNRQTSQLTQVGYFQRSSYSARQLEVSLAGRVGLWEGGEGSLAIPFTYGKVREVSTNEWERDKEKVNIGDISFGVQQLIHRESENIPAITLSLSVNAPTGTKDYRDPMDTWQDALDNSSGHWAISPGVSFVRTTDPAILFGGVSYQYSFERRIDGYLVQPGWGVAGYMGVGFALNEKLSLGTKVSHGYYSEMKAEGEIIKGSDFEPTDISFFASYRLWENWVLSPQVTFGLNNDAGASTFGARLTRRF